MILKPTSYSQLIHKVIPPFSTKLQAGFIAFIHLSTYTTTNTINK